MSATIPERFRKNGWNYKLLARTAKGCLYSQSRHPDLPPNGKAAAYEVMRIRHRKAKTFLRAGQSFAVEAGEYLPGSAEWGRHGWTFVSLADAQHRLNAISATPHQKPAISGQ
jgi:hypothetical protein